MGPSAKLSAGYDFGFRAIVLLSQRLLNGQASNLRIVAVVSVSATWTMLGQQRGFPTQLGRAQCHRRVVACRAASTQARPGVLSPQQVEQFHRDGACSRPLYIMMGTPGAHVRN